MISYTIEKISSIFLISESSPRLTRGFVFVSTKAMLVRKNRQTFRAHKPKAPSGRELPTKSGEGERVTIELVQIQSYAGSFRHGYAVPPSSRRKAMLPPDIHRKGVTHYTLQARCVKKGQRIFTFSVLLL